MPLLHRVDLKGNRVVDISTLLGLDRLKVVTLTGNPLSEPALTIQIPALREAGIALQGP